MNITAAVATEKGKPLTLETLTLDEPRENEVLVKIVAAGICRTDVDVIDQFLPVPMPIVLGHEGAGIVEKVGSKVTKVKPGDHVILSVGSCGECEMCRKALTPYCFTHMPRNFGGSRLDGSVSLHDSYGKEVHSHFFSQSSHATHCVADQSSVIKVPQEADLKYLAPFGCGIMTGSGAILNTLRPEAGTSIVIFGTGAVGLSALMAAKIAGCSMIIAVDINEGRLELAREMGATHTINVSKESPVEMIKDLTDGRGAHYSFESSGVKKVMHTAMEVIREKGICIITGLLPQGTDIEVDSFGLVRGRTMMGSVMGDCNPDVFLPRLVQFFLDGKFPVDKMMSFYPLAEVNKAIEDGLHGDTIKAVLTM
ncbi:hypothetical protein TH53_10095 [Pedobacter lusitanus]|uniref:Enoyl reductase (ER) domain-containing protein n=1 Tax=Pedobacter lusitanus TaxID=1503925 RepID=A0A0D0GS53_9SPHI|nr:NAD(P)-dependent alcohol dehydrogenase [Pedobacter lusitanus]KIO77286.1 hypothetical protein TH53_10095 [Pedobacter lusitanus]